MIPSEHDKMHQLQADHWWYSSKRAFITAYLKNTKLPKNASLLDLGCGTGANLPVLNELGFVVGTDYSSNALSYYRQLIPNCTLSSANSLSFTSNSFNLVTALDILYHQNVDDKASLQEVHRVLKPQGHLLVTDCAHNTFFGPHDQSNQARLRYSKSQLENTVSLAGFDIVKSSYTFFLTFPLFVINRLIEKLSHKETGQSQSSFLNPILTLLGQFEAHLLTFTNLPIGSSIIILAQKPNSHG